MKNTNNTIDLDKLDEEEIKKETDKYKYQPPLIKGIRHLWYLVIPFEATLFYVLNFVYSYVSLEECFDWALKNTYIRMKK